MSYEISVQLIYIKYDMRHISVMISHVLRHVIAAGHCMCSTKVAGPETTWCVEGDENQIKININSGEMNQITIHGGSMDQSTSYRPNPESLQYRWKVSEAYVMPIWHDKEFRYEDIGIALINDLSPNKKLFFDKDALYSDFKFGTKQQVRDAKVIPLCLASEGSHLVGRTLTGAGWGSEYNEVEEKTPRDPTYSSCMTSEKSFREYRFQNCDMKKIKANNWQCRTDKSPPRDKKCKQYIKKAFKKIRQNIKKLIMEPIDIVKLLTRDIFYFEEKNGDLIKCVRLDWTHETYYGWCELPKLQNPKTTPWGICSPSCGIDMMKVG